MLESTAIIALGSNLGDRWATLDSAVRRIEAAIGPVIRRSTWIETEALLAQGAAEDQPKYLNGIVLAQTTLFPAEILQQLLSIEQRLGRSRSPGVRWEPRTIDLDLIDVGSQIVDLSELCLPHPEMHRRAFVLEPLVEVWPDWEHPLLKKSARELLAALA